MGLSSWKGKVLRRLCWASGGLPAQLAPTWNRKGRGSVDVDKCREVSIFRLSEVGRSKCDFIACNGE